MEFEQEISPEQWQYLLIFTAVLLALPGFLALRFGVHFILPKFFLKWLFMTKRGYKNKDAFKRKKHIWEDD